MENEQVSANRRAVALARPYMGKVAWPTVALGVMVAAGFGAALGAFAAGRLPAIPAFMLCAVLTYFSYTPLHEAAHENISGQARGRQWLNDLCGYLMAPIIAIPFASHRQEHFTHHRYTNQPARDPDYLVSGFGKTPFAFVTTLFRFLWVQNVFFARHGWATASFRERTIYCMELAVSIGWRLAFLLSVNRPGTAAVIIGGYFAGGLFTAYWFAYRPHHPYQRLERFHNTNILIMPAWMKPLEWFWLGQNLHAVHHLFPRVPFYRYHALYRDIAPILREQGTPILEIFSRTPISSGRRRFH